MCFSEHATDRWQYWRSHADKVIQAEMRLGNPFESHGFTQITVVYAEPGLMWI